MARADSNLYFFYSKNPGKCLCNPFQLSPSSINRDYCLFIIIIIWLAGCQGRDWCDCCWSDCQVQYVLYVAPPPHPQGGRSSPPLHPQGGRSSPPPHPQGGGSLLLFTLRGKILSSSWCTDKTSQDKMSQDKTSQDKTSQVIRSPGQNVPRTKVSRIKCPKGQNVPRDKTT